MAFVVGLGLDIASGGASELFPKSWLFKLLPKNWFGNAAKGVTKLGTYELEITHGLTKSKNVFAKLMADIELNEIQKPLKFVDIMVKFGVDGYHRFRAAKELGIQKYQYGR